MPIAPDMCTPKMKNKITKRLQRNKFIENCMENVSAYV